MGVTQFIRTVAYLVFAREALFVIVCGEVRIWVISAPVPITYCDRGILPPIRRLFS